MILFRAGRRSQRRNCYFTDAGLDFQEPICVLIETTTYSHCIAHFRKMLRTNVTGKKRVRVDHLLRVIRQIVNAALKSLYGEFAKRYSPISRESILPERLMRVLLLRPFYSIRSKRQLVDRVDWDLLFRWFVGLGIEDPVWDATTFTKIAIGG